MERPGPLRRCQLEGCNAELTGHQRRWCSELHRRHGFNRTEKGRARHARYRQTEKGRAARDRRWADPERRAAMNAAVTRYQSTAKGFLARMRGRARERGTS